MALQRMDNVSIVVDDLPAAIAFFTELGMELDGQMTIDDDWARRIVALDGMSCEIAMMRMPDGHGALELTSYASPATVQTGVDAVPNAHGLRRIMFAVDDLDETLARLEQHGAELVGEVVDYGDAYRLCYVRGPEGILLGLAQPLS